MSDPVTVATEHLQAAEDALCELLEAPYSLSDKQRLRIVQEIGRLLVMQKRLHALKQKISV